MALNMGLISWRLAKIPSFLHPSHRLVQPVQLYVDSGKLQEIDSNEVEYYNISLQILEINVLSQVVNG